MRAAAEYDELARVAWHEGGHALIANDLRGHVGVVSIEPTEAWSGMANVSARRANDSDIERWPAYPADRTAVHVFAVPASVRRSLEAALAIVLAGRLAEPLRPHVCDDDGRLLPRPDQAPLKDLLEPQALRPDEVLLLARGNDPTAEFENDLVLAHRHAELLVGEGPRAAALISFIGREVEAILAVRRAALALLADALLEHRTLSGRDVRRILSGGGA